MDEETREAVLAFQKALGAASCGSDAASGGGTACCQAKGLSVSAVAGSEGATELKRLRDEALQDERPAFVHGRTLMQQTVKETLRQFKAISKSQKALAQGRLEAAGPSAEAGNASCNSSLNEASRGWLHFLWKKAMTREGDDWSINGEPHPWWDRYSFTPMCCFPRFDCHESSYFLFLAAERTPAWREVYSAILDGLLERYLSFWGVVDFNTQFGPDPSRDVHFLVPALKNTVVPSSLYGEYDIPGWTANGTPNELNDVPVGVQKDPIAARGMLFYKGWLSLVMGIRQRVGGDNAWNKEWSVSGVNEEQFVYTYESLVRTLEEQFNANNRAGMN